MHEKNEDCRPSQKRKQAANRHISTILKHMCTATNMAEKWKMFFATCMVNSNFCIMNSDFSAVALASRIIVTHTYVSHKI
jgi:hypothetical protein